MVLHYYFWLHKNMTLSDTDQDLAISPLSFGPAPLGMLRLRSRPTGKQAHTFARILTT